jgi:hypothetical protein
MPPELFDGHSVGLIRQRTKRGQQVVAEAALYPGVLEKGTHWRVP